MTLLQDKDASNMNAGFCLETRPGVCGVIIFGASGDLAVRKLFPALFSLYIEKQLPTDFYAVGTGRTSMTDDSFRAHTADALRQSLRHPPDENVLATFLQRFYYHTLRYNEPQDYTRLAERLTALDQRHHTQGNRLFYLSIPPSLYEDVIDQLGVAGLSRNTPRLKCQNMILRAI
jgi:glucose-6-phosphate 1-dehydrogenase